MEGKLGVTRGVDSGEMLEVGTLAWVQIVDSYCVLIICKNYCFVRLDYSKITI